MGLAILAIVITVAGTLVLVYLLSGGSDIWFLRPEIGCDPYSRECVYPKFDVNWVRVIAASTAGVLLYLLRYAITRIRRKTNP